jgi:hypothetical protein
MSEVPPIISPPVAPPPIPRALLSERELESYINRCKVICIVAGCFSLVGIAGGIMEYEQEGTLRWEVLVFAIIYAATAFTGAFLLYRRHPAGHTLAFLCFLFMLFVIPLGTIFGILGLNWLSKGRVILKRRA